MEVKLWQFFLGLALLFLVLGLCSLNNTLIQVLLWIMFAGCIIGAAAHMYITFGKNEVHTITITLFNPKAIKSTPTSSFGF